MCWIVFQPSGDAPIDKTHLQNAWAGNRDGAGYMFAHEGKLVIRKPFYGLKQFRRAYAKDHATYGKTSPFVIHLRFGTHGGFEEGNVHPHVLADGEVGLVHNGMLDGFDDFHGADSDTARFCKTVLAARNAAQLLSESFNLTLAGIIGERNRFVLMDGIGNVSIVNAKCGLWDGSRWYSNAAHRVVPRFESLWEQFGGQAPVMDTDFQTFHDSMDMEAIEAMERDCRIA